MNKKMEKTGNRIQKKKTATAGERERAPEKKKSG
jgi:hypothetical protein